MSKIRIKNFGLHTHFINQERLMKDKLAGHYGDFLQEIKDKIRTAQYDAAKVVNTVIISLYWDLGKRLSEKMKSGWGKAVVETLSLDIQNSNSHFGSFESDLVHMSDIEEGDFHVRDRQDFENSAEGFPKFDLGF